MRRGILGTELMNRIYLSLTCAWLIAIVPGYSGASALWNGAWKLNVSRSSIPGPSFSITISPTREYHYDNGVSNYSFRCDGKDYPSTPNRTISCVQTGPLAIDTTMRENSTKVATAQWSLSPDGQLLTIKGIASKTGGSVSPKENVFTRVSGAGRTFSGGWTNTKRLESRPTLELKLNDQTLHIQFGDGRQYADAPLDGSDAILHGPPGMPKDLTLAVKPHGPLEFLTQKKSAGRIVNNGLLKVSADGRTLIEEYWSPDRPEQKAVLVYDRD